MAPSQNLTPLNTNDETSLNLNRVKECAYITFLAGDGDYIKGVVCLAKGLRKVQAAYPLVVAVLPDVPEDHRRILVNQGCVVRPIEPVPVTENKLLQFARPYFGINYSKLRLWEIVEYEKMIYLDADIQVFENIDNLFDMEDGYFYSVVDCICEMSNQPCHEKIQWPSESLGQSPPYYFNGGMFMFEPSLETYHQLLDTFNSVPSTSFAEQDLLNVFFKGNSKALDPAYNLLLTMLWRHPEMVAVDKVKVVHYCAPGSKPWKFTGEEEHMDRDDVKMFVKKWWDIYNDDKLDAKVVSHGGPGDGGVILPAATTKVTTANAA
jgi:inositol 3-alpha-galactosyltransferase